MSRLEIDKWRSGLYKMLFECIKDKKIYNLHEMLAVYCHAEDLGEYTVDFGKYKGKPASEVPEEYLEWANRENCLKFITGDIIHEIEQQLRKRNYI